MRTRKKSGRQIQARNMACDGESGGGEEGGE